MKKIKFLCLALMASILLASCGSVPKAEDKLSAEPVKLDPHAWFEFENVRINSLASSVAMISINGMIVWSWALDTDCYEAGWDLKNMDLSAYDGIRVELQEPQEMKLLLANNPGNDSDCWGFEFNEDGVCYAPFDGEGNIWNIASAPDLTKGFEIKLLVPSKLYEYTQIKRIEVYKKGNPPIDFDNTVPFVDKGRALEIFGVRFGSAKDHCTVEGNVINWEKYWDIGVAGWKFPGRDMSEYDRVRVEIYSTDIPVYLRISSYDSENSFGYLNTEENVWEANLSGEGSFDEDRPAIDFTQGFCIRIDQYNNNEMRMEDYKTVVKSIQFLKPGEFVDE